MICAICGREFAGHGNARVCGEQCARERHRRHQRDSYNKQHAPRRLYEWNLAALIESINSATSQR